MSKKSIFSRIDLDEIKDKLEDIGYEANQAKKYIDKIETIIKRAFSEKPFFFSSKSSKGLVSPIVYIITDATQRKISKTFHVSEVCIRNNYQKYLELFPWLPRVDIRKKRKKRKINKEYVRCIKCKYFPEELAHARLEDLNLEKIAKEHKIAEVHYRDYPYNKNELLKKYYILLEDWGHQTIVYWSCYKTERRLNLRYGPYAWRNCEQFNERD